MKSLYLSYTYLYTYSKINRNQLKIVVKATYGLHPNKYFEIMNLTFWKRSLVTKRFGLHSNSRGADEIKGLSISIDFRISSPCFNYAYLTRIFANKSSIVYSSSNNLISVISRVLIDPYLNFCSLISPTCCNLPRKCTPVK